MTRPFQHNSNRSIEIFLGTMNEGNYLNVGLGGSTQTIHPDDAKRLRDELIKLYPLALAPAAAPASKFKAGDKVTYKAIVGYGARGMDGRKGVIKDVLANEWYMVNFTGGPFDNLIKVHSDYLAAQPVEPRGFKVGDKVRRTTGQSKGVVMTVVETHPTQARGDIRVDGMTGWRMQKYFELVTDDPVEAVKAAIPTVNSGRYLVVALEGANYVPGSKPKVHVTDIGANAEAERLAKEVGGTFHVFKATFEASREKPVIPPVKTTKL